MDFELAVHLVEDVVSFALRSKRDASAEEVFASLIYFIDNDAFLELT